MDWKLVFGGLINLLGIAAFGVVALARPTWVVSLIRTYSWPTSYWFHFPKEGEEYDERVRSIRKTGISFICFTAFLAALFVSAFRFSATPTPKRSVLADEPVPTQH